VEHQLSIDGMSKQQQQQLLVSTELLKRSKYFSRVSVSVGAQLSVGRSECGVLGTGCWVRGTGCWERLPTVAAGRIKSLGILARPTAWSGVLLEKLAVPQLLRKFPYFMEPEGSLQCNKSSLLVLF